MTITHELQSSLVSILGWARLLQTKSVNPETTAQALATIKRNATIEAKLIKNLLDVANILSGKLRLKSQLVDLASLVRNVTATFHEAAQAKHIQLLKTVSEAVPNNVFADGDRLKQVVTNLLENAIKFTPAGGQITICLEAVVGNGALVMGKEAAQQPMTDYPLPTTDHIHITVSDTGIGIHPDFLPNVFNRFTQAEVPSRHTPGGVELGLTTACYLVEFHHGTIEAASEGEGRGATFTVRLPLVNAELKPNLATSGR